MALNPRRTVDELRELQQLTGNEDGAQRVAWTDTWVRAQDWMAATLNGKTFPNERWYVQSNGVVVKTPF